MKLKNCSAIILAGGKSGRMGQDKAFVTLGAQTLLEKVLAIVELLFSEIVLVVRNKKKYQQFSEIMVIEDEASVKGKGPLAGIYSGLNQINNDMAFVVACDMPNISKQSIKDLVYAFNKNNCTALLAVCKEKIQPLFSVYAKDAAPFLLEMLNEREHRGSEVEHYLKTKYFELKEEELFFNVNTPDDLAMAQKSKKT